MFDYMSLIHWPVIPALEAMNVSDKSVWHKDGFSKGLLVGVSGIFFFVSSGAEIRPLSQWDLGDFFPNLKKKNPNLKKKDFFFFF